MRVIPIQPADGPRNNGRQATADQTYLDPQMYTDPPPKNNRPILVNGQALNLQDIAHEAQNHPMPQHKPGWAWYAAAQALVWRSLFLQEAAKRALQPDPIEIDPGKWETDEEALIRQLFEEVIPPADIDEAQLRAHYETHAERYRGPSLYEAAHILFMAPPDDQIALAKALKEARAVSAELQHKPQRFAHLAREHSDCPSSSQGGLMGQIASGDVVPEFEAILQELDEGQISAPMQTRYGYHLVRLDQRALGQPLPFESVRPQLRQAEEKAHWVRAGRAYMQQLLDENEIEGIDMTLSPWAEVEGHE